MEEVPLYIIVINHRFHVSVCVVCSQVCQVVRENGDTFSYGRTTEAVFTVTNSTSFTLFLKGGDEYTDPTYQQKFTRYNQRWEASVCVFLVWRSAGRHFGCVQFPKKSNPSIIIVHGFRNIFTPVKN